MDQVDPKDQKQLSHLLLLSPETGQPMRFCSPLKLNRDGTFSFDVENPATFERYRVTCRVEEILPGRNGGVQ
jgi:hypothetical protein